MREDVADGYVTIERARKDYGVVVREVDAELAEYELDADGDGARARAHPRRAAGLARGGSGVGRRALPLGELDVLDLVRHYGVILDWGTGELLPKTTEQFRAMLEGSRSAARV